MRDLENLVRYETEGSSVDFKAAQYDKAKHNDLLTDVIALANADVEGDRYIVLGVKLQPDGSRRVLGVPRADFLDASTYQQLVSQNVEPELQLEYVPIEIEGALVGVVCIRGCANPPYMMKKDRHPLQQGDAFIRKGTHQTRLLRADLDRILERRTAPDLTRSLVLSLSPGSEKSELVVPATRREGLPSALAAERIKKILAQRESAQTGDSPFGFRVTVPSLTAALGGATPYEGRDTQTLLQNLAHIEDTYSEDDQYELLEVRSHKLQIHLFNGGGRYIEDANLVVVIGHRVGLVVSDRILPKPVYPDRWGLSRPNVSFIENRWYPDVETQDHGWRISASIGDVRHGMWEPAFGESLRMAFGPDLVGQDLELDCRIHAKNLPEPYRASLSLSIVDAVV